MGEEEVLSPVEKRQAEVKARNAEKQEDKKVEDKVQDKKQTKEEQPKEEPDKTDKNDNKDKKRKELKKHFVDSSNIDWIAYDSELNNLYVGFKGPEGGSGSTYVYYDVPVDVWEGFLRAGSKGRYLHLKIKRNNQYKYKKL